jgi:NitT/TauT family transport system substrate-binding protein
MAEQRGQIGAMSIPGDMAMQHTRFAMAEVLRAAVLRATVLRATWFAIAGSIAIDMSGAVALAQTKIVLRTDFKFNGYVTPLALAIEKGFYREAGFDVAIEQGQGSATTIQTVATGVDDFGLADSATAVLGISSQNVPVKIIAVYNQTATMGLIYHADAGFTGDLAQLKGKVVISSAGSADARQLEPTLAAAGMKLDDVKLQLVDINARVPLFLQTPGAFLTGFATGDLLRVRAREPAAKYVPYAKYGLVAYGIGLIVRTETIAKSPGLVKKFVAASQKGWEAAATDPEAAVAAGLKLYPDVSAALLRDGLKISLEEQLHTPNTAGHPIGWTAEEDWKKMLDVLKAYGGVAPKAPSAYYTNEFIAQ